MSENEQVNVEVAALLTNWACTCRPAQILFIPAGEAAKARNCGDTVQVLLDALEQAPAVRVGNSFALQLDKPSPGRLVVLNDGDSLGQTGQHTCPNTPWPKNLGPVEEKVAQIFAYTDIPIAVLDVGDNRSEVTYMNVALRKTMVGQPPVAQRRTVLRMYNNLDKNTSTKSGIYRHNLGPGTGKELLMWIENSPSNGVRDPLTGLFSRHGLLEQTTLSLTRALPHKRSVAMVVINLDDFKSVNSSLGRAVGDRYLQEIATALLTTTAPSDIVARLDADEFALLCRELPNRVTASQFADQIRSTLNAGVSVGGRKLAATASVGVVVHDGGSSAEVLLEQASAAAFLAKSRGGDQWAGPEQSEQVSASTMLDMEADLREGMANNDLYLRYQPIFDLSTGKMSGVEALLRWNHPTQGLVSPDVFISVAERRGLIEPLGEWVLNTALAQSAKWQSMFGADAPKVAINLSVRQLAGHGLPAYVAEQLNRFGLGTERVCLELTESQLIDVSGPAMADLSTLAASGICLAIDDFGTGHAGFNYLRRLPVNVLKIDKSFVDGLGTDSTDTAIATSIIALGKSLGLHLVAEGVETAVQLDHLRQLGCTSAQGWLWAPALPAAGVEELVGVNEAVLRQR